MATIFVSNKTGMKIKRAFKIAELSTKGCNPDICILGFKKSIWVKKKVFGLKKNNGFECLHAKTTHFIQWLY